MSAKIHLREALCVCLDHGKTFAAFRRPHGTLELWAQHGPEVQQLRYDALTGTGPLFLVSPFAHTDGTLTVIRPDVRLTFNGPTADAMALNECQGTRINDHLSDHSSGHQDLLGTVQLAKRAIKNGHLQKVVLARTVAVDLEAGLLPDIFLRAMDDRPDAFLAMVHTPGHGLWLGASPERLLIAEGRTISTDALAGTSRSTVAGTTADSWGKKEKDEQEFVTRDIVDKFRALGLEDIHASDTEVVSAGEVAHLRTNITAGLGYRTIGEVLSMLHPTPAVCGTPRAAAAAFIAAHEPFHRSLYAGFWGPFEDEGRTDLFVNIRCLRAFSDKARIFVGAGITKDSEPELEWAETEQKALTWLRPIQAVQKARIS